MKNKLWSFGVGVFVTLLVAGLCHIYLRKQENKAGTFVQSPYWDLLESFDLRFSDLKYKFREPIKTTAPVVLVAIDEPSIREIGRWPWGRDVIATLTEKLLKYEVKSVGMDIVFSEPERGFPENDEKMAKLVAQYPDRVILGAYSEDRKNVMPYQDYCINEAFLASGGESIAKLNPSFVVDDVSESFEELQWNRVFDVIFPAIHKKTEIDFLTEHHAQAVEKLTDFQKRHLQAEKIQDTFKYCALWLTPDDFVYQQNMEALGPQYQAIFDKHAAFAGLSLDTQLAKFKSGTKPFPILQYGYWQGNIPAIQEASQNTASFIANLDVDGYVRRYPLFYRSGNKLGTSFIPSLALQSYLTSTGYRADAKVESVRGKKRVTGFQIMDPAKDPEQKVHELPIDAFARMVVNYYGPANTLPYVSAKDLFSDQDQIEVTYHEGEHEGDQVKLAVQSVSKKEFLKGKAVILGLTSIGVYDLRNTPVAANFPGPEIHLSLLANLFEGNFIHKLKAESLWLPALILGVGVLLSWLLANVGAAWSLLCMVVTLGVTFAFDRMLFEKMQLLISSLFVFGEVVVLHFSIFIFKYFAEERKRSALKQTFSKYVSPAVVDELLKDEENLKLGGRKQELSVFFSDVRGFTEFSEKMDPQELSQFLNEYLTPMTEIIFNNKGTLDKYMGDGLMAFFGAPIYSDDHARQACVAALQSQAHIQKLKEEFLKRGWPKLEVGIGVNTGFASVGNMGSKIVQSYTVIGDSVNLGSRLEGTTKEYGTPILVSEYTYAKVKDHFIFREVDRVRVKGKKEPVRAFELISEKQGNVIPVWLSKYHEAYKVYHRRDFHSALSLFQQVAPLLPGDVLIATYIKRCEQFIAEPPDSAWDGVYERRAK